MFKSISKFFNCFDKTNDKYYNFISFVKDANYGKEDYKKIGFNDYIAKSIEAKVFKKVVKYNIESSNKEDDNVNST